MDLTDSEVCEHRFLHIMRSELSPETIQMLIETPVIDWPCHGGRFPFGMIIETMSAVRPSIPDDLRKVIEYADGQCCDYVFLHAYDQDFSAEPERDHTGAPAQSFPLD